MMTMLGACIDRRQQHGDEIDRHVVDSAEIDWLHKLSKDADHMIQSFDLAMGNGDAVADPRGAQPLALQHHVENLAGGNTGKRAGALGEFLQRLLLGADPERRDDGFRRDQIGQRHADLSL
jgi:hypothetical protein